MRIRLSALVCVCVCLVVVRCSERENVGLRRRSKIAKTDSAHADSTVDFNADDWMSALTVCGDVRVSEGRENFRSSIR